MFPSALGPLRLRKLPPNCFHFDHGPEATKIFARIRLSTGWSVMVILFMEHRGPKRDGSVFPNPYFPVTRGCTFNNLEKTDGATNQIAIIR